MPADDVSDLKDVFDAINKLCETMKTSPHEELEYVECDEGLVEPEQVAVKKVEILHAERWDNVCVETSDVREGWNDLASVAGDEKPEWSVSQASLASSEVFVYKEQEDRWRDLVSPNDATGSKPECQWKDSQVSLASSEVSAQRDVHEERWSDTLTSPPSSDISATREPSRERWSDCRSPPEDTVTSDTEPVVQCASEMYYTASSEVSLISDMELHDKVEEVLGDKKECVIAGHVAAMRERFESMTRANTPCPDLARSVSPSLDVFTNNTVA